MRKITMFVWLLILAAVTFAQAPQAFNYQAVIRDAEGNLLENQAVGIKISLLQGSATGTEVYVETHATTTNQFGQVDLKIGTGTVVSGQFDTIAWGAGPYYLQLSVDLSSGSNYLVMGTTQMLSVPYALYAQNISNSLWNLNGSSLYYNEGNIGLGTLNPTNRLDIDGTLGITSLNTYNTQIGSNFIKMYSGTNIDKWLMFRRTGNTPSGNVGVIFSYFDTQRFFIHNNGVGLKFDYSDESTANPDVDNATNKLFIHKNGQIGIGTDSPETTLHIKNSSSGYNPDNVAGLFIESSGQSNGYYVFQTATTGGGKSFSITNAGNVGIGKTNPTQKLDVNGTTKTKVLQITGGSDLAEPFPMNETLPEGLVVVIDENNPGKLTQSSQPYDKRVAGIVSGAGGIQPGLTLKQEGIMEGTQNIALTGRVYVKATTENGAIKPGDRLTTSSLPGHAMKATDDSLCPGSVIGKAMSSLEQGEGLVLVLVNLQ